MIKIDPIRWMLPFWSDPLVAGRPEWLSPPIGKKNLIMLNSRSAILTSDILYRDRYGMIWPTRRGLPTDGVSYPPIVDSFEDRWAEETLRSALSHDNRYVLHKLFLHYFDTRERADESLKDGLMLECPDDARRDYMFVRLGGQAVYDYGQIDELTRNWIDACALGEFALDAWIAGMKNRNKE